MPCIRACRALYVGIQSILCFSSACVIALACDVGYLEAVEAPSKAKLMSYGPVEENAASISGGGAGAGGLYVFTYVAMILQSVVGVAGLLGPCD